MTYIAEMPWYMALVSYWFWPEKEQCTCSYVNIQQL
jgi:hypothetical protein